MGHSDYLFSSQGFWAGFGRVIDLSGTFDVYNVSLTEQEADRLAISNDVLSIVNDLRAAFKQTVAEEVNG